MAASSLSRLLSDGLANAPSGVTHIPSFNDFGKGGILGGASTSLLPRPAAATANAGSGLEQEVEAEMKTRIKEDDKPAPVAPQQDQQPKTFAGQGYAGNKGHSRCAAATTSAAALQPAACMPALKQVARCGRGLLLQQQLAPGAAAHDDLATDSPTHLLASLARLHACAGQARTCGAACLSRAPTSG
jgi:hypothetical protein